MPTEPTAIDTKKLNSTIEKALKALDSTFGNSAENKRKQELQKEALKKWISAGDDLGEKFDTFQERLKEWGEENENYREGIKGFFMGVKEWKNQTMQQRTAMGHTFRFMASTWKATGEKIFGVIKNAFSQLRSQVMEVLGPVGDVLMLVKDFMLAPVKFLGGLIAQWWKLTPPGDKRRNKFLNELVAWERYKAKKDLLGGAGKKKGAGLPYWAIGIMVVIGALYLLGEEVMSLVRKLSLLKIGIGRVGGVRGFFTNIIKFLGKFEVMKKWMKGKVGPLMKSGGTLDKVMGFFSGIGQWFSKLASMSKLFRVVLTALRVGMKIFGWPLQIIISLYDFYKGWGKTSGDMVDKFIGGMKNVVNEFFGVFADLFGWVIEWVLGLFGVEVTGVGDTIRKFISDFLDIMYTPFLLIKDFFKEVFSGEGTFKQRLVRGLAKVFMGMVGMFNSVIDYMIDMFGWIPGVEDFLSNLIQETGDSPVSTTTTKESNIKNKRDRQRKQDKQDQKNRDNKKDKKDLANQNTNNSQSMGYQNTNVQGNQGGGEIRQVPDEVDNMGMITMNFNEELF
jgi:hypothetical protein